MKNLYENYINGNVTIAKDKAKKFSWEKLFKYLINDVGLNTGYAMKIADKLKNR